MDHEKHNSPMSLHTEIVEKEDSSSYSATAQPHAHHTIDHGGQAVLLSIEGDEEAARTNLKLAADGHVSPELGGSSMQACHLSSNFLILVLPLRADCACSSTK
jgi:hypothetical protein